MKKIFYKIFIYFCLAAYLPLLLIYLFNFFYVDKYITENKKRDLIEVAETINIDEIKKEDREEKKYSKNGDEIYVKYINFLKKSRGGEFLRILNKSEGKFDIKNMSLNEYVIKTVNLSSVSNHFFLIKKISDHEIIAVMGETIVPGVVTAIMLEIYKHYSLLIILVLFLVSYILSKKFSEPIEILEKVSSQISNSNFTDEVEIKSKNELGSLGNNINKIAKQLQNNIKELSLLNKKLREELLEKEKILETEKIFMRAIGHELKTPIAIINDYIEALQDDMINENEIKKTYDIIYKEGMSINKIVNDINDYLKFGFKHGKINLVKCNINSLLNIILEKYYLDINQRGIKLKKYCDDVQIETDIKFMEIILNNLITNAITYVDENKKIEVELNENYLRISNSSEYIEEEILKKIFNPFYKIDKSRSRKYGGTGLGLSIVKNLLEFLKLEYSFVYDEKRKFVVFTINLKKDIDS